MTSNKQVIIIWRDLYSVDKYYQECITLMLKKLFDGDIFCLSPGYK